MLVYSASYADRAVGVVLFPFQPDDLADDRHTRTRLNMLEELRGVLK